MNSRLETAIDTNAVANGIMHDITDVDRMEKMLESELSSSDLFRIDCAILSSLRNATDFSRDLLKQLEAGEFETMMKRPEKTLDMQLQNIQQSAIADITKPLEQMFEEMSDFVLEGLK